MAFFRFIDKFNNTLEGSIQWLNFARDPAFREELLKEGIHFKVHSVRWAVLQHDKSLRASNYSSPLSPTGALPNICLQANR
jgi:hypothetical protein